MVCCNRGGLFHRACRQCHNPLRNLLAGQCINYCFDQSYMHRWFRYFYRDPCKWWIFAGLPVAEKQPPNCRCNGIYLFVFSVQRQYFHMCPDLECRLHNRESRHIKPNYHVGLSSIDCWFNCGQSNHLYEHRSCPTHFNTSNQWDKSRLSMAEFP